MSTRLSLSMAFVVVLGVLAMISGPVSPRDLAAARFAGQQREMLAGPALLAPEGVLDKNVAILSLSPQLSRMTNTVAALHSQPDSASKVVYTMMPGSAVTVAGYDANNTFAAITDTRSGTQLYGWMATSQLLSEEMEMQALGVTQVFSQASADSAVIDALGPYDLVRVVGESPDGGWVAVSMQAADKARIGWIQSNLVQRLDWQHPSQAGENVLLK